VQKDERLAVARSVGNIDAVHLAGNMNTRQQKLLHRT
jgi:hypothetical protein